MCSGGATLPHRSFIRHTVIVLEPRSGSPARAPTINPVGFFVWRAEASVWNMNEEKNRQDRKCNRVTEMNGMCRILPSGPFFVEPPATVTAGLIDLRWLDTQQRQEEPFRPQPLLPS